jgi:hypothetical protein
MNTEILVKKTLQWCNRIRKKQGKKLLTKLPKGVMGDPWSCPCGRAAKVFVGCGTWTAWTAAGKPRETGDLPEAVQEFVYRFDYGLIPEYVEDKDHKRLLSASA